MGNNFWDHALNALGHVLDYKDQRREREEEAAPAVRRKRKKMQVKRDESGESFGSAKEPCCVTKRGE